MNSQQIIHSSVIAFTMPNVAADGGARHRGYATTASTGDVLMAVTALACGLVVMLMFGGVL